MDTARWSQEMALVMKPMEEMVPSNNSSSSNNNNNNMIIINNNNSSSSITKSQQTMERRATTTTRPQKEQALACPRCNSTNTKFCYYNNYSLTQPRYFCKTCRRYWTEGGSLRNVPVGGGSRKNKRSSSSSSSSSAAAASASSSQNPNPNPIPRKYHDGGHDLNLAFAQHGLPEFGDFSPNNNSIHHNGSAMINPNRFGPFPPMPDMRAVYPSVGFSLQEVRPPTASFSLEGINGGGVNGGDGNGYHENGGRLLFPFEELKQVQGGDPPGFWSGMNIGGGGGGGSW